MSGKQGNFLGHLAGLRGLAIILVVLFHLNGQAWAQGYLGVDVFLVISGYLLFRSRLSSPGTESLKDAGLYLAKRVRRIVPPMAIIIILALVVGAFLMQPEDEVFVGRMGYNACLAKANIFLQQVTANYFAPESQFNSLLHLWYLSVALQIYLLWAVGNQALQRLPKWAIASTLTLVGAASLIYHYNLPLCEWLKLLGWEVQGAQPSYYDTLPRLWEVLAGGLVCCLPALPSRRCCSAAAALGLLAVLLPAVAGSLPGTAWLSALPSTLTVVAGTVLTLRYAPDTLTGCLLNSRALLWLGRISFSVYLVHMPLIVFGKLWVFGEAGTGLQVGLLVGSFLLGWLYWLAVEKRRFPWWLLVLVWLAALMFGRAARKSNGFSSIVPLPSITWAAYDNWHICTRENLCSPWPAELIPNSEVFYFMKTKAVTPHPVLMSVGDPAETPSFVLMGDSHAMCTYSGLSEALRGEKSGVYMTSIIMPFADYTTLKNKTYFFTPKKQKALMQWLEAHPELRYVIIAQRWTMRLTKIPNAEAKLQQFLCELKAIGKQPILIAPYPEYSASNTLHYQRTAVLQGLTFEDISPSHTREEYAAYNRRELDILQRMESQGLCTLIKPADALSEGERFHASKGDVSYMVDTDHLSPAGSIWFMQMLRGKLLEALSK